MFSRRAIRESIIQCLYCSVFESGENDEDVLGAFWRLALESDSNKLVKASAKAVLHLNSGRDSRYSKLVDRSTEAFAFISVDGAAEKLKDALHSILKSENQWQAIIDRVQRAYDPGVEIPDPELEQSLQALYVLNSKLSAERRHWSLLLQDFPLLDKKLEAIKASIKALQGVADRISMVQDPAAFAENEEVKHLQKASQEMQQFRKEVEEMANAILAKQADVDQVIESVVENYTPDRIDPVDRAILRLGAYEILYKEEIPTAVSINECIEISRRFASSDSPRFVNGVLDKIAKR